MQEHVALANQDVVNRLIKKEKLKEYPDGNGFLGVVHMMKSQPPSQQYIRAAIHYDNGKYMIHCQSVEQSRMLIRCLELQGDKTFARTSTQEFEINGYDEATGRIMTIARLYFDDDSEEAYFRAFSAVFDLAEKDTGVRIPFGHMYTDESSPTGTRIRAIILDMSRGQIGGLRRYFQSKFPNDDPDFHVVSIVKTCRVHFHRSIRKKERLRTDDRRYQGTTASE